MKENVRRELIKAACKPAFQWRREGGTVRSILDFSFVGSRVCWPLEESRVARGWACLRVPAVDSSCLGTAVGSKALAQAWGWVSEPSTWGPQSIPLTQLEVCEAHSPGLMLTNCGFHFYKPIWFPYSFSTYTVSPVVNMECHSARQTLHLPSQNLWLVGIQIIIIHDVPVYLIECSMPYVAWDKIAPNYPPK